MILIIDDDPSVRTSLKLLLKQAGYQTAAAANPEEALALLQREPCEMVLQDMNFSRRTDGAEGLKLLRAIKEMRADLPVILMTAWGSIALAVEGMRLGAADFVTKPWTHEQILGAVATGLGLIRAGGRDRRSVTRAELDRQYKLTHLVGEDPVFLEVLELIGRVAATPAAVLITGESGTGKEGVAEAIHDNSDRAGNPFVKVNLGGMAQSLFEAEMFGHTKGAFTGAHNAREGRFAAAHKGTIFLDEIGDLESSCQVKLLRVLQDRRFEPLGSSKTQTVDVRIISATNRPLADMTARGDFREDLLYRLNLIAVHLPPLRERRGDIPLLAQHFLGRIADVYRRGPVHISDRGLDWLRRRDWPGNIRELKQMVERTVLMSGGNHLEPADFERALGMQQRTAESSDRGGVDRFAHMTLEEVEHHLIEQALKRCGHNMTQTAEVLGLSRAALYRRLEKYGIEA